jgi:ABC-type cobalamin/Fe3+-siderophores transport system ATPase subunit
MRSPPSRCPRPFFSLERATFRLGDQLVFENTSWVFHGREQWAIIGANGSGKSLLADALRGRLPLVQGDLRYHFRGPPGLGAEAAIGHVSFEDRKRDVHGTVVQSRWNSLEEESALRVRDFLAYERVMDINPFEVTARFDRARPHFERRRRKAVALMRIEPFFDRALISLSNGETQRFSWRGRSAIRCGCLFWTSRSWDWMRPRGKISVGSLSGSCAVSCACCSSPPGWGICLVT